MKPKKLIRNKVISLIKEDEWEVEENKDELNKLYALKIQEELKEIQKAKHKDMSEFGDLLSIVTSFAILNGFTRDDFDKMFQKDEVKGIYENHVLTNLNPSNPSNAMYFDPRNEIL